MSFLLKRSNAKVYASWIDNFSRDDLGPVSQPWVHIGDGASSIIGPPNRLKINGNFLSTNGGGPSWEFQPFTTHWGVEYYVYWPVEGEASHSFYVFFTDSWARINGQYINTVGIGARHAPLAGGSAWTVGEYLNFWTPGDVLVNKSTSAQGIEWSELKQYKMRILIDYDQLIRVYVNGIFLGMTFASEGFMFGPERRSARFMNASLTDAEVAYIYAFDRERDVPRIDVGWQSAIFTDNFNRANGQVGNGWTVVGTNGAIVNNTYSYNSGSNGTCGILRNSGITTGRQMIRARYVNGNGTATGGLVLRSNAGGTEGLMLQTRNNLVELRNFAGSLTSLSTGLISDRAVSLSNGDWIRFMVEGSYAYAIREGDGKLLMAAYVGGAVLHSNPMVGLKLERVPFKNSNGWDEVSYHTRASGV